jgi:hypothetical protein
MSIRFRNALLMLNKAVLFACVSMYFGTGWSLVLFSFPTAGELTPSTYYMQFVPQVAAATAFFKVMTSVMMINATILVVEEWKTPLRWFGIGVLLAITLVTALTIVYIFPYNARMAAGIATQAELNEVLNKWMNLNTLRVSIWTAQWVLVMIYLLFKANRVSGSREWALHPG